MKKHAITGLTLIEVLIALAIVAIALTAVIKATSQSLKGLNYLETKTIANWVAQQAMTEGRLGFLDMSKNEMHTTKLLGRDWYWQIQNTETPNPSIQQLTVKIFSEPDADSNTIITLESFVYVPPKAQA